MPERELDSSQAVIVEFNLPHDMPDKEILNHVYEIEDSLDELLEKSNAGDCDGHEFGEGIGTIYIYGKNAEELCKISEPVLEKSPLKPMQVTLRYGKANDKTAKEKVFTLE